MAYEYFPVENKDVDFRFPVLILVGEKDSTGKVKSYCREWAKQTGYPLCLIKGAKHLEKNEVADTGRYGTEKLPFYCPKCKQESLIEAKNLQVTVVKRLEAKCRTN